MSSKSTRHRQNKAAESRLLDNDPIEQRALQIAREEGRDEIAQEDRERAEFELRAPNESSPEEPEIAPGMEPQLTAWDEAPASSGTRAPKVVPEDETSVGKKLTEKGLRGPGSNLRL